VNGIDGSGDSYALIRQTILSDSDLDCLNAMDSDLSRMGFRIYVPSTRGFAERCNERRRRDGQLINL
jgi:hypothetical protein